MSNLLCLGISEVVATYKKFNENNVNEICIFTGPEARGTAKRMGPLIGKHFPLQLTFAAVNAENW